MSDYLLSTMTIFIRLSREPKDGSLWTAFFKRYAPIIYKWCRQYVRQDADAEDITAIVLAKIFDAIQARTFTPQGKDHPRRWISVITTNTRKDLQRRKHVLGREDGTGADFAFLDSARR